MPEYPLCFILALLMKCPPKTSPVLVLGWVLRKGAIDGQEILHTGADYQQAHSDVLLPSTFLSPIGYY